MDLYLLERTSGNRYCFAVLCRCTGVLCVSNNWLLECSCCWRPAIEFVGDKQRIASQFWKTPDLQKTHSAHLGVTIEDFIATWTGIPVEQLEVEIRETRLG